MLAKNSMRNCVLAVEFNVPVMVTCAPVVVAELSTGKFCRSFAPVSASLLSLAVTPLVPRSIPSPALPEMLLPRILTPVMVASFT